jgi:hypothetical protein
MNRIANWKTTVVVLAGCVLTLVASSPAGACPAKARYHVYTVGGYTRGGPIWTYLGSYDTTRDAETVGKLAGDHWGGPGPKYRIVKGTALALPAEKHTKLVLYRSQGPIGSTGKTHNERVGEFRTLAEAAAAARRIVAAGDRFEILYWEF